MIDLDRVSDLELLRQVAKIQDAEIRRLHDKLMFVTKELATAAGGDVAAIEAQLRLLQKELDEAYRRTYSQGSERRPRGEKGKKERAPQKGHGPISNEPQLGHLKINGAREQGDDLNAAVASYC